MTMVYVVLKKDTKNGLVRVERAFDSRELADQHAWDKRIEYPLYLYWVDESSLLSENVL